MGHTEAEKAGGDETSYFDDWGLFSLPSVLPQLSDKLVQGGLNYNMEVLELTKLSSIKRCSKNGKLIKIHDHKARIHPPSFPL